MLHFDERDILSNTHEVEYDFVTRLYAKSPAHVQDCEAPLTGLALAQQPRTDGSMAARQHS
jgi:hypothetical protein